MTVGPDKENMAPATSSDPLAFVKKMPSPKRVTRKGRSKSIGPGALEQGDDSLKKAAKDRRKSAFVPATKSILSKNEDAEKEARRKTMVNRRVSFAPEATLHTWDVVEIGRDQTTSTESSEGTRRTSHFTRSRNSSSPAQSSSPNQETRLSRSPRARQSPRSPLASFENVEDTFSSGASGSSDASEGESEEEDVDLLSEDDTGTAMSLDIDDQTSQSMESSNNSTGSSVRLERALKQASDLAGTRGIEYDEYGDMSMELATEDTTHAFKPWTQRNQLEPRDSASLDQENINPFSPAFKASVQGRPETIDEEGEEDDMSMDVTKAVGGILRTHEDKMAQSPPSDATMDLTQAVGKITSQKRRRSTADTGSPGIVLSKPQTKRRRSSFARSSMGDDTMDLTMAVGGIQQTASPNKSKRLRSARRRSSGATSQASDATMDITRAVGGIRSMQKGEDDSFDGNEELSMELTTALGGIRDGALAAVGMRDTTPSAPSTPQDASYLTAAVNQSPKDQPRFKETPDLQAKKSLTPLFEQQVLGSAERHSTDRRSQASSPTVIKGSKGEIHAITAGTKEQQQQSQSNGPVSIDNAPVQNSDTEIVDYPDLPPLEESASPVRTPTHSPQRRTSRRISDGADVSENARLPTPQHPPVSPKSQGGRSPHVASTPQKIGQNEDSKTLASSIRLMSTPRKETLRNVTPKKQTPKPPSPIRVMTPKTRTTPKIRSETLPSPQKHLNEDLEMMQAVGKVSEKIGLQDFLARANIRFMDLTTTKRRMTTATTPSRVKKDGAVEAESSVADLSLENGVVAASCTVPELELYQHACHELKRYTKEGKQMISELEAGTSRNTPPLIQAYMHVAPDRKAALDAQMRDMKTNARFRSKELWYSWRSQLLSELMGGLAKIGEGLLADDEVLAQAETLLDQALPSLLKRQSSLQKEADELKESAGSIPEGQKEELNATRDQLIETNKKLVEKRQLLENLRKEAQEQKDLVESLEESKSEFTAAIQEANRVREACRGVSVNEVAALNDNVKRLEEVYGWSIASASSSPPSVTMTYKSELQLFLHPKAFQQNESNIGEHSNEPISLMYIADARILGRKPLTTTLRFFLQLLRASLQALPQCKTKLSDLLALVSNGWNMASTVAETERRLGIEALSDSRIVGDERLAIQSTILLTKVRSKVRVTFELTASVDEDLQLRSTVEPRVEVVYGEQYNEKNMTEFLKGQVGDGIEDWDGGVALLREKLIARGAKGVRK